MPENTNVAVVQETLERTQLSIARPLTRYGSAYHVGALPRHMYLHWRGLWHPETGRVYGCFLVDDALLPAVPPNSRRKAFDAWNGSVLCHCKPIDDSRELVGSESRYPDIPDRLDVYLLLRYQYDSIAFSGRTIAAVIQRTAATRTTISRLSDWENKREGGRYRRSRGRSQLVRSLGREPTCTEIERQYANSALRAVGLNWPRKPSERHKKWAERLEELGISVTVTDQLREVRHRTISIKMQQVLDEKRLPERQKNCSIVTDNL